MHRHRVLALICAGLWLLGALAAPARAEGAVGIVLLHGKLGMPLGEATRRGGPPIGEQLVAALKDAGYRVAAPELCWSRARGFDEIYTDCFGDIDRAIAKLKAAGATAIVVGGLSLGGNAAIAYGATHPGLLGVIGLSPADDPRVKAGHNPTVVASVAKAQSLIGAGQGDAKTSFDDVNTGPQGSYPMAIDTTPRIFLSFDGPDSPARIPANVAKLTMPLLWVAGNSDPTQAAGPAFAFAKAPPNPLNRYVIVGASHTQVPDAATPAVLAWLAALKH